MKGRRPDAATQCIAARSLAAAVTAVALVLVALFGARASSAQGRDAGMEAGVDAEGGADTFERVESDDPAVRNIRTTTEHIRALSEERLDIGVQPRGLFDLALEDERSLAVEISRLRALLHDVDSRAADAGTRDARSVGGAHGPKSGSAADGGDGGAGASAILLAARIELDRARLAFYSLPLERRRALLAAHARRVSEAATPSDAEARAREAEEQRVLALKAARDARSEAERLVSEEYARLLDVERKQAGFEKTLQLDRAEVAALRETTLGWQRRAREARSPGAAPGSADLLYGDLRTALRSARDRLDAALDDVGREKSDVPVAGPDPLTDLPPNLDATQARDERRRVEETALRLATMDRAQSATRASELLDTVDALNSERLALLPFLSAAKRTSITGFTAAGADQAASELRHLALIARYHRYAATAWVRSLRTHERKGLGSTVGTVVLAVLEWTAALGAFIWFRRRTPGALRLAHKRARESDRHERLDSPSSSTRVFAFALEVHRPVEWLALSLLLSWLLPDSARDLLEVQLVTVVVEWVIGGALVVVVVNAIAATDGTVAHAGDAPTLRLRSLRLVGRVVVAFGLVLVLTTRLVGAGTIYQWVLSTCWFASIPVFLVLVRWWREVVFERIERPRKKTTLERWVLANRAGWKSFFAATIGGVYLFVRGAYRAVRGRISRFRVTRSVLAYLFRRELGKLEAERAELVSARIADDVFEALGPDVASRKVVSVDADEEIDRLHERLRERRGGMVAVVGSFGMGKTTVLEALHAEFTDTAMVTALDGTEAALRADLGRALGLATSPTIEAAARALVSSSQSRAVLVDDAQRYVRPMMGGLATFDALFAAASQTSGTTTWVFTFDELLWLFLQRARGSRPLFDDVIRLRPWREEQIVELLRDRTADAGVAPSFERLLERLPPNADELDKLEALEGRAASYYRLLWDYAAGNPGVALHMWRRALGADADGATHVRFFQAPDAADLELLPDQSVFVLRAVLQLAPVTPAEIGHATMLSAADIANALRYAEARTYVSQRDGKYAVTWTWRRALSLFLQRRHLLVAS